MAVFKNVRFPMSLGISHSHQSTIINIKKEMFSNYTQKYSCYFFSYYYYGYVQGNRAWSNIQKENIKGCRDTTSLDIFHFPSFEV